jgi:HD superfamily phosphodiesterase
VTDVSQQKYQHSFGGPDGKGIPFGSRTGKGHSQVPRHDIGKKFIQHGRVTVYKHSVSVAMMCLMLAHKFNIEVDEASLVRGALLHDYFLYDWHLPTRPTGSTGSSTPKGA